MPGMSILGYQCLPSNHSFYSSTSFLVFHNTVNVSRCVKSLWRKPSNLPKNSDELHTRCHADCIVLLELALGDTGPSSSLRDSWKFCGANFFL